MKLNKLALGLSLVSLIAIAGCGSDAANDPLAGTWSNTSCYGTSTKPADVESCKTELTFSNDLNVNLKAEWVSLAATAMYPGCTTTKAATGQQWSADHAKDTFTVMGKASATMERTNCVNATDDLSPAATTDLSIPSGDTTYTLSGDTLTVQSGSLKGAYTRDFEF